MGSRSEFRRSGKGKRRLRDGVREKPSERFSRKCSSGCSGIEPRRLVFSESATRRCSSRSQSAGWRRRRGGRSRAGPVKRKPAILKRTAGSEGGAADRIRTGDVQLGKSFAADRLVSHGIPHAWLASGGSVHRGLGKRSEEHTSELQ